MSTTAWKLCRSVFVIVHGASSPSDQEWDGILSEYAKYEGMFKGILVLTDGGMPSSAQRERVTQFWAGKELPRTAILHSSMFVQGALTALSWILPKQKMKAFKSTDVAGALVWLQAEKYRAEIEEAIAKLRMSLNQ